jgi:tetratricopeptide (TPR) repeat protein
MHPFIDITRIWQARCFYLYGRYDMAWITIQKALVIRQYIGGLTPMRELVPLAALILLAKIGDIAMARKARKRSAAAMTMKQQQALSAAVSAAAAVGPITSLSSIILPPVLSSPPTPSVGSVDSSTTESKYVAPLSQEEADVALAALAQRHYAAEEIKLREWWSMVDGFYAEIQTWRISQEANFGHMVMLVAAEMARYRGKNLKAMTLYNKAIEAAKEGEWHYHEALCCERVGLVYVSRKDHQVAGFWLRRSLQSYRIWGARRKVRQMKQQFHRLLDVRDMPAEPKPAAIDAPIVARISPLGVTGGRASTGSAAALAGAKRSNSLNSSSSHDSLNLGGTGIGNTGAANVVAAGGHRGEGGSPVTSQSIAQSSIGNTEGSPRGVGSRGSNGSSAPNAAIAMWRARAHHHLPAGLLRGPASHTAALNTSLIDDPTSDAVIRSSRSNIMYSSAGGLGPNPWASGPIPSFVPTAMAGDTIGSHETAGVAMSGMGMGGGNMKNNSATIGSTAGVHDITNSRGGNDTIGNSGNQGGNQRTTGNTEGTMNNDNNRYFRSTDGTFGNGNMMHRGGTLRGAPQQSAAINAPNRLGGLGGGRRGVNAQIDAQSMLDAAQAMSQEMQLDRALMSLLTILLTCAGAESGLLISKRANKWVVEARANSNGCEVLPSEGEGGNAMDGFPLPRGFGPRGLGAAPEYDLHSTAGSAFSGYGGGAGLAASRYMNHYQPQTAAAVDASNIPSKRTDSPPSVTPILHSAPLGKRLVSGAAPFVAQVPSSSVATPVSSTSTQAATLAAAAVTLGSVTATLSSVLSSSIPAAGAATTNSAVRPLHISTSSTAPESPLELKQKGTKNSNARSSPSVSFIYRLAALPVDGLSRTSSFTGVPIDTTQSSIESETTPRNQLHWSISSGNDTSGKARDAPSFSYRPSQPSGLFRSTPPAVGLGPVTVTVTVPSCPPTDGLSTIPDSPTDAKQKALLVAGASPLLDSLTAPLVVLPIVPTPDRPSIGSITASISSSSEPVIGRGAQEKVTAAAAAVLTTAAGLPTAPTSLGVVAALWLQLPLNLFHYVLHKGMTHLHHMS